MMKWRCLLLHCILDEHANIAIDTSTNGITIPSNKSLEYLRPEKIPDRQAFNSCNVSMSYPKIRWNKLIVSYVRSKNSV
jgi:hypothetical protein